MTFTEIGKELGITQQGAHLIYKRALEKLRRNEVLRRHLDFVVPEEATKKKHYRPKDESPMPTCKHCHRISKTRRSQLCDRHYWQAKRGEAITPIRRKAIRSQPTA